MATKKKAAKQPKRRAPKKKPSKQEKFLARTEERMRDMLDFFEQAASHLDHGTQLQTRINRDGTIDGELRVFDWSRRNYARQIQKLVVSWARTAGVEFPMAVYVATAIAFEPDRSTADKTPREYLKSYRGVPMIVLKYRRPINFPELLVSTQNTVDKVGDFWIKYVALRLRYQRRGK